MINPNKKSAYPHTILAIAMTSVLCLAFPATAQDQDGVTAMCLERDDSEVCVCASEALRDQIKEDDYALYAAIGVDYLARLEAGESRVDAWMEASRAAASKRGIGNIALMGKTNEIGNLHRDAIKACGS